MTIKLPKEARKLLNELTKDLSAIDKARDKIEPYYSWESDGIIDDIIQHKVSAKQFKYFEACKFKVKALWYIKKNLENWDERNRKFVKLCVKEKNFQHMKQAPSNYPYLYSYFPFFEAVEFENLLMQGKAFLDTLSKALGCLFKESPNNVEQLEKVLRKYSAKDVRAKNLLSIITSTKRLKGVIVNPKREGKKSIRDLVAHREKIDIKFWIWKNKQGKLTYSKNAVLEMWHPEIEHLDNYLVINIASKIWYYALGTMVNSFKKAFNLNNVMEKYL